MSLCQTKLLSQKESGNDEKKKKNRNDEKNSWQEKMLYSMRWTQKKKTIHEYIANKFDHIR